MRSADPLFSNRYMARGIESSVHDSDVSITLKSGNLLSPGNGVCLKP